MRGRLINGNNNHKKLAHAVSIPGWWLNHMLTYSIIVRLSSNPVVKNNTWWFIPLNKWVLTLVINGISGVSPLTTGFITHLLSGMNQQVVIRSGQSTIVHWPQQVRPFRWSLVTPCYPYIMRTIVPFYPHYIPPVLLSLESCFDMFKVTTQKTIFIHDS